MNGWVNNWIMDIVDNYVRNYIEDEYVVNASEKECNNIIRKVTDLIFQDGDLENEIIHLIEDNAEWFYYHCVKPRKETDE